VPGSDDVDFSAAAANSLLPVLNGQRAACGAPLRSLAVRDARE
jgi:hypothetical protein